MMAIFRFLSCFITIYSSNALADPTYNQNNQACFQAVMGQSRLYGRTPTYDPKSGVIVQTLQDGSIMVHTEHGAAILNKDPLQENKICTTKQVENRFNKTAKNSTSGLITGNIGEVLDFQESILSRSSAMSQEQLNLSINTIRKILIGCKNARFKGIDEKKTKLKQLLRRFYNYSRHNNGVRYQKDSLS